MSPPSLLKIIILDGQPGFVVEPNLVVCELCVLHKTEADHRLIIFVDNSLWRPFISYVKVVDNQRNRVVFLSI